MEHHIGIARYYEGKIEWDNSPTNELRGIKLDENTPCATQSKNNKFGKYVPVCCSFKPKQDEKIWNELNWEQKTTGDKIRTIVAYDDSSVNNQIVNILKKNKDVEIVAVAQNGNDAYKQIAKLKPEMVFTKYDFKDSNGLEIIKKSKEVLKDKVPVFNVIAQEIPSKDFRKAKEILGDKMNTIIKEQTETRYADIIEDYKDYLNSNIPF